MKRAFCLAWLSVAVAAAHPLGNYSINHYTRFEVRPDGVFIDYVLDFAEFPTQQVKRSWRGPDPQYWISQLDFRAGSDRLNPLVLDQQVQEAAGQGGLPVLTFRARLRLPAGQKQLEFEDRNYPDRAGWKEIVIAAAGDDVALTRASHTSRDLTRALTIFRLDANIRPPHDTRARLAWQFADDWSAGAKPTLTVTPIEQPPAPLTDPNQKENLGGDQLTQILQQPDLPWNVLVWALAIAFGIGAAHALEPGHGKTMVAAYLVGSRGTWRHAVWLGGITTFTHTFTVFLLGLATLGASQFFSTERIYPLLSIASALTMVGLGVWLLVKRIHTLRHHHHHHHHHRHEHHHRAAPDTADVTFGNLIALGVSGGLVPCPAALVLLLGAIAVGKVALGLSLLVAFSLGLSVVLTSVGLSVVYAKRLARMGHHHHDHDHHHHGWAEYAPVASAGIILLIGLYLTWIAWRQLF